MFFSESGYSVCVCIHVYVYVHTLISQIENFTYLSRVERRYTAWLRSKVDAIG